MTQGEKYEPTRLILIPAGTTDWHSDERIQGNVDLPLSAEGVELVNGWIAELAPLGIQCVYSVRSDPGAETAKQIAKALRVKHRWQADLAEVNFGLWQGMHLSNLKHKHPKVYKQWMEQPDRVAPPDGESLTRAQARLEGSIGQLVKANPSRCIGVVLGEVSLALVRLTRAGRAVSEIWDLIKEPLTWHEYVVEYSCFGKPSANGSEPSKKGT